MIIVFSGLDGAGKSTQIEMLRKRLSYAGCSSKILWARGGYTPCFELAKKLLRKITGKKLAPQGASEVREAQMSKPLVQKLWLFVAIADLILFWAMYMRALRMLGYFIICDRYIDDTLLDFRRNFPKSNFERSILWRLLTYLIPSADVSFLFWVPVSVSQERSLKKREPFPDDRETLEWRQNAYMDKVIFSSENYLRIDGQMPIDKIEEIISSNITLNLNTDNG